VKVFISPAAGDQSFKTETRDGYTLDHWRRGGMAYWVISDTDPAALRQLSTLLGG
jgi:anti-sigma factor RsiW